jgi:uncharacterized cupin superfamily protein
MTVATRRVSAVLLAAMLFAAPHARAQTVTIEPTGTVTANGGTVTFITGGFAQRAVPGGFGTVALQITGTFSGQLEFEGSVNCSTYAALVGSVVGSSSTATSATATGQWQMSVAGLQCVRVRASAWVSGTATVTFRGAGGGGSASGGGSSSVTINDPSTSSQKAAVNASGQLSVNCANCTGSGVSQQDNTAFTAGTSNLVPMGAMFDDVASATATENAAAVVRMTQNKGLHVNFRNAAGTEIGTSSNPIQVTVANTGANATAVKVDNSAVTQPISAASLPLPALAATSTKQSDGSQKTQIVDGSGNVIASTSNNLNVQCANCSGSGASAADEASFTAGSSTFAPAGGFFQTTATNNALTTGQQGLWQMTANRAGFVNLRNAAGTEVGTSTTPVQVSLANTAANATAVKVDGSAVTQPVSGTVTSNAGTGTFTVAGGKTNNNAAPGATNVGVFPAVANTSAPTYTDGNMVGLSTDTSGGLRVNCVTGCGGGTGGTAMADKAAFTTGTTQFTPTGGVFDDTPPTALSTGNAGAFRLTNNRAVHVNFRNQAGTELATASNPLQVSLANTGSNATAVTVGQSTASSLKAQVAQLASVATTATLQSAATANGNGTVLSVDGMAAAVLTVNCSSCSGGTTVNFELSEDASNFVAVKAIKVDTNAMAATLTTSGVTVWTVPVAGFQQLRARISAYSAGTITVTGHSVPMTTSAIPGMQVDANGNLVTPSVDATTNTTAQTTGPQIMGYASAATPTAVGADGRSIALWTDTVGRLQNNVAQINGVTPLMGNGVTGTGSPRVTIASDNTAFTVNAAESGTWTVQPGNTANTTAWLVQPVPGTTNGASTCVVQSAASTNSTNCKGSAGLLYGVEVLNTTSTLYYLRLYNASSAPTCSSATGFIRTIPIPHGTGAGAGVANFYTVGETYGTGLGFCLTGGGSSTDNTNAATGVYVTLHYK